MFLTVALLMMTAGEMTEEVRPFFLLEWFRRPLQDQWEVGPNGPEPAVESMVANEGTRVSDTLTVL